jgi:hypothetical protein
MDDSPSDRVNDVMIVTLSRILYRYKMYAFVPFDIKWYVVYWPGSSLFCKLCTKPLLILCVYEVLWRRPRGKKRKGLYYSNVLYIDMITASTYDPPF